MFMTRYFEQTKGNLHYKYDLQGKSLKKIEVFILISIVFHVGFFDRGDKIMWEKNANDSDCAI